MALDFNVSDTFAGLGTALDQKVPEAGIYAVEGKMEIPTLGQGSSAQSALVVVVNKNGSPVYTGPAGSRGFNTQVSCAASDEITVVLSSSAAIDSAPNAVKSTITLSIA